jgi:hypothetical protein
MCRLGLALAVLVMLAPAAHPGGRPITKRGNLFMVAIGQEDGWEFLPEGFDRVMRDRGKAVYADIQSRVLTGKKATRKELLDALDWARDNAGADDLVMVFIACHGTCTRKGESIFATRNGTVRPRDIKSRLAKLPCQAIVVNDACQSGNWPKEFDGDPMPPNVTALCCCLSTQNSGIEFDITLFEALYGKADFNKDGVVDLDEVIKYCGLRIKEVQGGKLTPVLHKARSLMGLLPLTKANPSLVGVLYRGEVFAAVVQKQDGDEFHLHVIGFSEKKRAGLGGYMPALHPRENIFLSRDGPPVMVENGGRWHAARLVGKEKLAYSVRYVGTKAGEDVVAADRVRHLFAGNPGEEFTVGMFRKK